MTASESVLMHTTIAKHTEKKNERRAAWRSREKEILYHFTLYRPTRIIQLSQWAPSKQTTIAIRTTVYLFYFYVYMFKHHFSWRCATSYYFYSIYPRRPCLWADLIHLEGEHLFICLVLFLFLRTRRLTCTWWLTRRYNTRRANRPH
jgi:hypothetical protein